MIGRLRWIAAGMLAVVFGAGAGRTAPLSPEQLPRGAYETYWRQVGGDWVSGLERTTIQGCAAPASSCGSIDGGPFLAGRTIGFRASGCSGPPITIRCVVQKAGLGRPGAARPTFAGSGAAGLVSGRYVLRTATGTGSVALSVSGTTFSGTIDWNQPGRRQDPIFAGKLRGNRIGFIQLCGGRVSCVQKFAGTVRGDEASGTWSGPGAQGSTAWTLAPRRVWFPGVTGSERAR